MYMSDFNSYKLYYDTYQAVAFHYDPVHKVIILHFDTVQKVEEKHFYVPLLF
jgi:hypothetical protein